MAHRGGLTARIDELTTGARVRLAPRVLRAGGFPEGTPPWALAGTVTRVMTGVGVAYVRWDGCLTDAAARPEDLVAAGGAP